MTQEENVSIKTEVCQRCFSGTQGLTNGMVGTGSNMEGDRFTSFYCPLCKRTVEK